MTSSVIGGWTRVKAIGLGVVLVVGILIGAAIAATPAGAIVTTLYVAPGTLGVGGSCASPDYNTISAAVSGATSGDTIDVCPGTYNEMVHLKSIPLTLNGSAGSTPATINASGQPEGVVIEGAATAGSVIQGFNIENAQGEGVLVEGTSNVSVTNNVVSGNDLACILQTGQNPSRSPRPTCWRVRSTRSASPRDWRCSPAHGSCTTGWLTGASAMPPRHSRSKSPASDDRATKESATPPPADGPPTP